jgi:rhodanese-related sulfurtransferase
MSLISSNELKKLRVDEPRLTIIDIRTAPELLDGKIPGAVWMDVSGKDFIEKIKALPKDVPYCLYCASGGRTMMVVPFMEELGFTRVYELDGGIFEWVAEGNGVEKLQ